MIKLKKLKGKLARGELLKVRIDLRALVDSLVAELRQADLQRQMTVQVAADMEVSADSPTWPLPTNWFYPFSDCTWLTN